MPFMLQGFGTTFYGKRDFRPDGSYLTTEWIVVLAVPVFPIRSLRIIPLPGGKNTGFFVSEPYRVLERRFASLKQVTSTWGFLIVLVGYWILLALVLDRLGLWDYKGTALTIVSVLFAVLATIPAFLPLYLRRRARARSGAHNRRQTEVGKTSGS